MRRARVATALKFLALALFAAYLLAEAALNPGPPYQVPGMPVEAGPEEP